MSLRGRLQGAWRELRGISPENPSYSLSDPAILDMLGIGDGAGSVSPGNALESTIVFTCVRILAESLAQLPIKLYEQKGRQRNVVTEHPLAHVIGTAPNPMMNRVTFFEQQQTQLALWGNCYSQRIFDQRTDETIGIYPLPSSQVTPFAQAGKSDRGYPEMRKYFRVLNDTFSSEDIIHVPLLSLDGIKGLSPIQLARLGIGLSLSQSKFASSFYDNGTRLSGSLTHPNKLSAEAATRLRENWTALYTGPRNAGKVAILEEGMTFNGNVMPLTDAQFIETAKLSREQLAAIWRIPPHMVGHLDKATFSNIEHQSLEFAVFTLGPYLVKYEQVFNALLSPSEQRAMYFKFNMDALLRGDVKARFDAYGVGRQWGWLSANDVLELEDRSPIGKEGDIYLQPVNMMRAGDVPPLVTDPSKSSGGTQ